MNRSFCLVISCLCILGCDRTLTPEQYITHFKEVVNENVSTRTLGDKKYSIRYKTPELVSLEQIENDQFDNLDSIVELNKNFIALDFRIASRSGRPPLEEELNTQDDYGTRLQYLFSDIGNNLFIVNQTDTQKCLLHHFERSYGLVPYHNISLIFHRPSNTENLIFLYQDQLFGSGPINIKLSDLIKKEHPKLKIKG